MPGAKETLALLAEEALIYQSLLTGNLKEVARIKVETFGLAQYFDLEASAYGGDDHDRAELVPIAQRRARAITGATFANNQTVLIGDPERQRGSLNPPIRRVGGNYRRTRAGR